jgi:hypothetical protein
VQENNEILYGKKEFSEISLRNGEALPAMPFRNDWTIGIIILSVILFSIVHTSTKTLFYTIAQFFLFRKTMENETKTTKLFRWESVLLSISSFFIISIFAYFAVSYKGIVSGNLPGFTIWLFSMGIIVSALFLRHIICLITGVISNSIEIFNHYTVTVYQVYRFAGFFLFIVIILFFYTPLINAKSCFVIGCSVVATLYLIRVFRLFFLFMNHKVSIFYFILYLCALEFLPVLISVKYFSGLI